MQAVVVFGWPYQPGETEQGCTGCIAAVDGRRGGPLPRQVRAYRPNHASSPPPFLTSLPLNCRLPLGPARGHRHLLALPLGPAGQGLRCAAAAGRAWHGIQHLDSLGLAAASLALQHPTSARHPLPAPRPRPRADDLGAATEDESSVGISWANRADYCQNVADRSAQGGAGGEYRDWECVFPVSASEWCRAGGWAGAGTGGVVWAARKPCRLTASPSPDLAPTDPPVTHPYPHHPGSHLGHVCRGGGLLPAGGVAGPRAARRERCGGRVLLSHFAAPLQSSSRRTRQKGCRPSFIPIRTPASLLTPPPQACARAASSTSSRPRTGAAAGGARAGRTPCAPPGAPAALVHMQGCPLPAPGSCHPAAPLLSSLPALPNPTHPAHPPQGRARAEPTAGAAGAGGGRGRGAGPGCGRRGGAHEGPAGAPLG